MYTIYMLIHVHNGMKMTYMYVHVPSIIEREKGLETRIHVYALTSRQMLDTVHLWDFTIDCVHFRCTITHLCSSFKYLKNAILTWYLSEMNKESIKKVP